MNTILYTARYTAALAYLALMAVLALVPQGRE